MPSYRRVLVVMDREPRELPRCETTKIENATDAWMEAQRLMAHHATDTVLIVADHPRRAIMNFKGTVDDFWPDYEFREAFEEELRGVTPEYEFVWEDQNIGVFRVSDLPQRLFFSALVTPEGHWKDTPQDADDRYARWALDDFQDRLAVVLQMIV